ncbi:MAG TPA: phage holin family protein [Acidimicrobiales bacterium]|nr:phage holin family protein [Acidimicrobiales bacterium]
MSTHDRGGLDREPAETAGRPGRPVDVDQASLGELFGTLTSDLGQLVRSELELARVEIREEAAKAGRAAGMLVGGAVAAVVAVILLASAAAWGLAEVIDAGWAFLVVGVVVAAVATGLALSGRRRLQEVRPVPEQTVDTLKEDARWARAQVK